MATHLKRGTQVRVPWGLDDDREGVVVDVWGDPAHPSHIRVELAPVDEGGETVLLLLVPGIVTPVQAA